MKQVILSKEELKKRLLAEDFKRITLSFYRYCKIENPEYLQTKLLVEWGDAVNTASRMESHGEPGKIHVSEEFMQALSLSSPTSPMSLHFQERGEMHIKGKGMMKTYFLEKANA